MAAAIEYISLARKAGRLALGEEAAGALVKRGGARLMFVCADTSPGAKRRAEGYVYAPGTPLIEAPFTKAEVSAATGRPGCSMAAFNDLGLAAAFAAALAEEHGEPYRAVAAALETKRKKQDTRRRGNSGNRRKHV